MKRYLIRGGKVPTDKLSIHDYLNCNILGSNVGNFMYLYGIIRTLTLDEDVVFESTKYKYFYNDKEIDDINEKYDGFIIPLADAFRETFMTEMVGLTRLVKKLKIPCYVIGVGISSSAEEMLAAKSFVFEKEARDFCKAVLEKSSCIGVRGETTGEFLDFLGFEKDKDFRVIGCPSMYTYGENIKIRDTKITPQSRVCCNMTYYCSPEAIGFIGKSLGEFTDVSYIPQMLSELKLLYLGKTYKPSGDKSGKDFYPCNLEHKLYAEDRVRFFLDVFDWVEYLKGVDFSFGTRLHGNIPAVLAGTPALFIPKDIRMKELAKFHNFAAVNEDDVGKYKDIWEIIESKDFKSPEKVQKANFDNYIDFLHTNGLSTIYDNDMTRTDAPLDDIMAAKNIKTEVSSIVNCSKGEAMERLNTSLEYTRKQKEDLKKLYSKERAEKGKIKAKLKVFENKEHIDAGKIVELVNENIQLKKDNQKYQDILDAKSVRMAVGMRNKLCSKKKKIILPEK